jgi:DNA-binding CsgD family transcriptional regulator
MTNEIIGRDEELAVVEAFLDRPVDGLRALVLEGDAGIGKSTIWLAAVAAARERSFRVLTSRPAETERTLPNVVLGDLFADVGPDVLAALPAPRRHAFECAVLREESDLPVDARALGVAIKTLLPALADGRPLVLAIDDDQWMDPSSTAILRFALRRSLEQPVLLLLSRRINGAPATPLEEAIDPTEIVRLRTGPMSVGAIQMLLRQRLGATLSRPTLLELHEVSGGNPFYALELARAGAVDPGRDSRQRLAVPPSLERLVNARLGGLDAVTRRALLLIATHGRFPVALVAALEVPPEALDAARAANVIETADGVVRFTHPLLASALYQGAAGEARRAAHRRMAAVVDDPVPRGRHLALASDEPSEELAADLESAASAARHRGMPIAAAELAGHALRLTPTDALDDRHRRALATARAQFEAGEGGRARAMAADLAAVVPAGRTRAEVLLLQADLEPPGMAVALLTDALGQTESAPELQAAIHARLADEGRYTKGIAWAERHASVSLRLAERLDDDALRATALSILASVRFDRGDRHALELAERAYRLAAGLDDAQQVKNAGWSVGYVLLMSGLYERARVWMEGQLNEWRDRDEQVRSELLWYLSAVEFQSGNWSVASEYAEQVREIGAQYGIELPQHHLTPAQIALHRGQIAVARDHSRRALSLARGQLLPMHIGILGTCDLWSGNPQAALASFLRAEEAADGRGWSEPAMRLWRGEYAEALLQLGRIEDAAVLVADWELRAARLGRERVLVEALRCRGQIAAARGDLATAGDLLEAAVDRSQAAGEPFARARALLALGVVRLRARQKRTAREALEAALAGFEALGAAGWAATARGELARIGGRERIEGLSPSELRVAELVAEGRTNREIASLLFLGERTVAGHLTHVYAKLGIRSRTELARRLPPRTERSAEKAGKVATS